MPNQWDNLFKNEGIWNGSFTKLTPEGIEVSDVPSCLTLERTSAASARFQVRRYPTNQPPQETKTEFASINQSSLFCEDGSFTKGSTQWSPIAKFGTEFGLTLANARLRLVQLFDGGQLSELVLIRETRDGTTAVVRPPLSVDQLLGTWRGQAIVYRSDWSISPPMPTELTVSQPAPGRVVTTGVRALPRENPRGVWRGHVWFLTRLATSYCFYPMGGRPCVHKLFSGRRPFSVKLVG